MRGGIKLEERADNIRPYEINAAVSYGRTLCAPTDGKHAGNVMRTTAQRPSTLPIRRCRTGFTFLGEGNTESGASPVPPMAFVGAAISRPPSTPHRVCSGTQAHLILRKYRPWKAARPQAEQPLKRNRGFAAAAASFFCSDAKETQNRGCWTNLPARWAHISLGRSEIRNSPM